MCVCVCIKIGFCGRLQLDRYYCAAEKFLKVVWFVEVCEYDRIPSSFVGGTVSTKPLSSS